MRRERRKPTRREWAQITSSRPVVQRVIRREPLRAAGTPMPGDVPDATPCWGRDPIHDPDAPPFGPGLTGDSKASEGRSIIDVARTEMVRRYYEQEREGILWERLRYHEALVRAHSATFELLIGRQKSEVERLERLLGINNSEAQKGAA